MRSPFGPYLPTELEQLERERRARELLEQLMPNGNALHAQPMPYRPIGPNTPIDPRHAIKLMPYRPLYPDASLDPRNAIQLFDDQSRSQAENTSGVSTVSGFPFRQDNRKSDGAWDSQDATRDNIKGTSVDHYEPVWPRWRQTPPPDGEGEFVSDEPFFDIDEISQKAEFYPPGRPLVDKNIDGNPSRRQRINDTDAGNLWRRRLMVGRWDETPSRPANSANSDAPSQGKGWTSDTVEPVGLLSAATFGSHEEPEGSADNRSIGQYAANDVVNSDQRRMVTSSEGREFIKQREGSGARAYSDPAGFPTIGYGHKLTPADAAILPPNATLSDATAGALLTQDIETAERAVYRNVTDVGALSQEQFDALVSFVFNVGEANFRNSRMRALINSGNHGGAASEFRRFVYSRGAQQPGLVNRRTLEENLFSKGVYK